MDFSFENAQIAVLFSKGMIVISLAKSKMPGLIRVAMLYSLTCFRARAMACSRAPLPINNTFIQVFPLRIDHLNRPCRGVQFGAGYADVRPLLRDPLPFDIRVNRHLRLWQCRLRFYIDLQLILPVSEYESHSN